MDGLFEILIILAIFLLPALEGILKKRKRAGERTDAPSPPGEPAASEETVSDELWEDLVGGGPTTQTAEVPGRDEAAPAEVEAERPRTSGVPGSDEEARREAFRQEAAVGGAGADELRSRASRLRSARSGLMARRGRTATPGAHPLLDDVDAEALRRAVVWREILGPPAALKEEADGL